MKFYMRTIAPDNWDRDVAALGGTINHTTTHARYVCASQANTEAVYMALTAEGGDPIGAGLGFQSRSSNPLMARLSGRFWLTAVPVVKADVPDGLRAFLQHMEEAVRREGCMELFVGSSASPGSGGEFEQLGYDLIRRLEFELSLARAEADLWEGVEYKRRKNIRKAERLGVTVHELPGEQGVAKLRELQGDSSRRIVARGGRDITYKGGGGRDPVNVLVESGWGRIVVARVDDEIVSAGLFTHFNGLVYHTLSGHSKAALKSQAPTFLIWEMIKRYKAEGSRRFNFGGCKATAENEGDPEHGVYVYKMGFAPERLECTSGEKILRKTTHRIVSGLRRLRR